ncbi:hypothetical protein CMV_017595 [Castanea mollissima]|uniref:Uncharacterized protein n=1 Tax=Castanea mollissima TaxID=60419 RepID=A0A8J4R495_9ROSI|nr:hypothetical protein CMV_029828 [Castanea mollissima]KAF3957383.1 hypothetical protein CMV_017595 [Castanea mollissima]
MLLLTSGIIRNWVGIWELLSAKLLSILLWFLSGVIKHDPCFCHSQETHPLQSFSDADIHSLELVRILKLLIKLMTFACQYHDADWGRGGVGLGGKYYRSVFP